MSKNSSTLGEFYFASRSSPAAERWVNEFLDTVPRHMAVDALAKFQREDIQGGLETLTAFMDSIAPYTSREESKGIFALRWYHGARAYYLYVVNQFDQALHELELAEHAAVRAISLNSFLIPFVSIIVDLRLKRANIERRRYRWQAMKRELTSLKAMFDGVAPFCAMNDTNPIGIADVEQFLTSIPQLTDDEKHSTVFRWATDAEFRRHDFEAAVAQQYVVPGVVVFAGRGV